MGQVKLVWITPNAEQHIMYCARVSNPRNQESHDTHLLTFCIKNRHWSIFEMASMCIEINTSRSIARQILRHRSFSFQEFSQRYQNIDELQHMRFQEQWNARRQDKTNRQNSIDDMSDEDKQWFIKAQIANWNYAHNLYKKAINKGIAKECARIFLPEGQTRSRLYMTGSIRSWIHYLNLRTGNGTQLEHIEIADKISNIFSKQLPTIYAAMQITKQ